eukprot:3010414-Rhodomonas_salina.1
MSSCPLVCPCGRKEVLDSGADAGSLTRNRTGEEEQCVLPHPLAHPELAFFTTVHCNLVLWLALRQRQVRGDYVYGAFNPLK